ncbi:MAG: tRNA pseudouridine(38-40) synthase TruA, partial [Proteobacteria bacterium]|nr:tRNA pseudouridine(38-40) synthase TruA [Pseudomonadota bacterium]
MRLQLEIAYHGSGINGWQSQACGNTVQDYLEKAFLVLCREHITVHGAGRTDAGVHAEAQCAHADVPSGRLSLREWLLALNAHLPDAIRVMKIQEASIDFHARFSAKGKIYRYTIWNGSALHPLMKDRAWHVPGSLDFEKLHRACELFTGTHDFAAFSLSRSNTPEQTVRTIHAIENQVSTGKIDLTFEGEGFLYKMVRILSAAIIRHASGRVEIEELAAQLGSASPAFMHTAPAVGLCLVRV